MVRKLIRQLIPTHGECDGFRGGGNERGLDGVALVVRPVIFLGLRMQNERGSEDEVEKAQKWER